MASKRNNLKEFDRWLKDISEEIEEDLAETVEYYTEAIVDEAKKRAPVRKKNGGTLKNSISSFYSNDKLTGYAYTNIEYAIYQEFGTRYIPAREYMYLSYDKYMDEFIQELKDKGFKPK